MVPRGSGTSLSGGALPLADGVLLGLSKFKRIREIDFDNRWPSSSPASPTSRSAKRSRAGFYYAPDPSSQIACTIGGNVAENSGGVHCLKYGMTTNNVLGCELVLMTGEILRIGGKALEQRGLRPDGLHHGLRRSARRRHRGHGPHPAEAGNRAGVDGRIPAGRAAAGVCVARIIGAGIIPGGMEMMDKPAIHAAEAFVNAGYPLDVEALLIIELDGPSVEVDDSSAGRGYRARLRRDDLPDFQSEEERLLFWAGRKAAFPAVGRISPDYLCMDGTIPRGALPQALARIRELGEVWPRRRQRLPCRRRQSSSADPLRCQQAGRDGQGRGVRRRHPALCVELGGVLTGEHGVGVEKRDLMPDMFSESISISSSG